MQCEVPIAMQHGMQRPERSASGTVQSGNQVKGTDGIDPYPGGIEEKQRQDQGRSAGQRACKGSAFCGALPIAVSSDDPVHEKTLANQGSGVKVV